MAKIYSLKKADFLKQQNTVGKWILIGIPVIILLAFPLHFIYEWSGNQMVVGIFAPVNESVWEHLKLTYWPMLIWWVAGYLLLNK